MFATKQEKASEPSTEEIICVDDDGGIHNRAELMDSAASVSDRLKAVKSTNNKLVIMQNIA